MVKGLEVFREWFRDFTDRYVLIGGTAADAAMGLAGEEFRATKDLDIVLVAGELDQEFFDAIWRFIEAGGYGRREKSDGERCLYRFSHPEDDTFPFMLEFFSILPEGVEYEGDGHLTPLPTDELGGSLSAILLDEDYYDFILDGRYELDGLTQLRPDYIIPLKAKAFLDLTEKRNRGEEVQSKDIRKHRRDVFRLNRIIDPESCPRLQPHIANDLVEFLNAEETLNTSLQALGYGDSSIEEVCQDIRMKYGLDQGPVE